MGKKESRFPKPRDAVKAIRELGTLTLAAQKYGYNESTFRSWLKREDLWDEVCKARDEFRAAEVKARAKNVKVGEPVSREEILETRVKELVSAHKAVRKQEVHEQRILDAIKFGIETSEVRYSPLAIPRSYRSSQKHEFVLLWSDLHAGEVVTKEETNGINEYDWTIMLQRHDKLRESLFSYQDNRPYPVEKLNVFALGDMLSGNIHDELAETNEIPLAEATVQLGLDGGEWIGSLKERFKQIAMAGIVGNHPRAHRKPRAKQQFDNADWTSYHVMRQYLSKYPDISFEIPKASMWPVEIAENWRALLFHGDGIRSTMPGVPWGGVMRRAAALQNQYTQVGKPIDLFCLGHFHTANLVEFPGGRIAMNASVKGVDEYSVKAFGGGRGPQQLLLTFHPRRGLTDMSIIDLEEKKR